MRLADGLAGAFNCSTMPTADPYAGLGITYLFFYIKHKSQAADSAPCKEEGNQPFTSLKVIWKFNLHKIWQFPFAKNQSINTGFNLMLSRC